MQVELTIDHVGLMGQGVGHDAEANIYFVPGAVPGDRVLVKTENVAKKYRDAELVEIVSPSPDRRDPQCRWFTQCGGCDWLHWEYEAQVRAKDEMLRHVIERSAWLPEKFLPPILASQEFGYRNRIQLRSDGKRLGFYRKKSHDIVDIEKCEVADPRLNESMAGIRAGLKGDEGAHKIELVVQKDGSVLRLDNRPHAFAGFSQIHDEQNENLKSAVAQILGRAGSQSVLELYCGNGNLTFAYLGGVAEVFGVDCSASAVEAARAEYAQRKPSAKAMFWEMRVDSRLMRRLPREFRGRYDTLLLDPPRSGAEGCLQPLLHEKLKSIVYVSCSPVAFTKDIQCLKESFRFEQVQIVDMFPHTRHIEFVAFFSR